MPSRENISDQFRISTTRKLRNEDLYSLVKSGPLSLEVKKYRRYLGHELRRETMFKDTLRHIQTLPIKKKRPPKILETYQKEFGTGECLKLEDLAFAKMT